MNQITHSTFIINYIKAHVHIGFLWQKRACRALGWSTSCVERKNKSCVVFCFYENISALWPPLYDRPALLLRFLLFVFVSCFFTTTTNQRMLALILCTGGLSIGDVPTAQSDSCRARRMWVHTGSVGDNNTVSIILSSKRRRWNRAQFRTYFRLTKGKFDLLLQNVGSTILRAQTTFRDAMSPAQRLCISLWWVVMPTAYSATIGCLKRSHSENIDALLKSTKIVDSRTKYPDHPEKRLWVQCFFSRQLQASAYALSSLGAFEINQKKPTIWTQVITYYSLMCCNSTCMGTAGGPAQKS